MSRVAPNCISFLFAALAMMSCSDEPRPVVATKHPQPKPAAAPKVDADLVVTPVRFPFSGPTLEPNVVSDGDGGFLVSWIEKSTTGFIFAPFRGGSWFQPRMITHGRLLANKADFPSIAVAPEGTLYAQWIEGKGESTSIRIAQSTDNGATWSTPLRPHADVEGEFGFASLLPAADRSTHVIWLDASATEKTSAQALHAATIDANGKLSADSTLVDPRVCDCCQTAAAMTDDGPVVAYRDRSPEEVRDISIVRLTAKGWTSPKTLHADGWKIAACPVNGPQLDASGKNVVAAWFTAAGGRPRVNVAFSSDSGATFGAPVTVDDGQPAGHVDVAFVDDGSAIVTWVERTGDTGRVEARRVRADRTRGNAAIVAEVTSANAVGFPRLAVSKQNVAVVWNGGGVEPSVRMATIQSSTK
ncbi:MAG TPA: sialidase family protein [Thermoanaerobaculia bacterium]|nr:sialidase family protein [Thermoanaerobaculia bacterium]